jgi:TRAP-type uncharacterized transport system substrate-binding protein
MKLLIALVSVGLALCAASPAVADETASSESAPPAAAPSELWTPEAPRPPYGIDVKRPVIGGACPQCVWGPLSEFVRDAMRPYGWDVQICYNCNLVWSPRMVAETRVPRPLSDEEIEVRDPPPPDAPVDFGVTETMMLQWAYKGVELYEDNRMDNLRLIAHIEDPGFLLIAAKKGSGITDLTQLRDRTEALRILTDGGPWLRTVFEYYGITEEQVVAKGGRFSNAMEHVNKDENFDLIVSSLASLGNNFEANVWTEMSQKYDLVYFPIPQDLRDKMQEEWVDSVQVDLPYQYFRGVEEPIPTIGRSGHGVIGRDDTPDEFAYAVAKAIDEQSWRLKWFNRPYSIDRRTIWRNGDVPLHPGAARYYREQGYIE